MRRLDGWRIPRAPPAQLTTLSSGTPDATWNLADVTGFDPRVCVSQVRNSAVISFLPIVATA